MNDSNQDLKRAFADLREHDASLAPDYRSVVGRRPSGLHVRPGLWVVAAALLLLVIVTRPFGGAGEATMLTVDLTTTRWVAPTDYLLKTPNSELMRTMPNVMRKRTESSLRRNNNG